MTRPTKATAGKRGRDKVLAFLRAAQNGNTRRSYESGMRQFALWATTVWNPAHPAEAVNAARPEEYHVAAHMQYMLGQGRAMSTVNTRVNAIADALRFDTTADYHPCSGALITQMRAVLVPMTKPKTQKREISRVLLHTIVTAALAVNDATSRRDACTLTLAFTTFLRASEVVRMNRGDVTFTTERIGAADVTVMRVHVDRMCKNDKQRVGHERLVRETSTVYDAARMMRAYLASTSGKATAPLFTTRDDRRMALGTPRGRLAHWLKCVGATDPAAYGFHSMRAGGATHAARAGVAVRHIKELGNWKSDAVNAYVRLNVTDRLRASNALSRHA